jgi:hypothetical protein
MISAAGALAAGLLLFVAADADEISPRTLIIEWPGGEREIVAATNAGICAIALSALLARLWRPVGRPEPPLSASCSTGNAFAADAFCIKGHDRDCGRR